MHRGHICPYALSDIMAGAPFNHAPASASGPEKWERVRRRQAVVKAVADSSNGQNRVYLPGRIMDGRLIRLMSAAMRQQLTQCD